MSLGNIDNIVGNGAGAKVPDLDWASIDIENKDNIPVPMNIEIVPQLSEAWAHRSEKSAKVIPNKVTASWSGKKITEEDIEGVVNTAKKEMMTGLLGKPLAMRLSSLYPPQLIKASAGRLKKIAEDQGILGNVYVDISPFDTCKDAARYLGKNKIRLAKYVTGKPRRSVCSSHHSGYCNELNKKVADTIEYDKSLFDEYGKHLKVAGIISKDASIESKEDLRTALLSKGSKKKTAAKSKKEMPRVDFDEVKKAFDKEITRKSASLDDQQKAARFREVKPVLAFIQNEMLKGHMGGRLKEAIQKKYPENTIRKYADEIKKIASLQGLLGNVYVDISLYDGVEDAIKSIKNAATSPSYVVQTVKKNAYDNADEKVAKVTGCQLLPRDGKIDVKIASSYIDDLQFSNRISSNVASKLKTTLQTGNNVLGILRSAFIASQSYKPQKREAGVQAYFHQAEKKKYANRDNIKLATHKAIEAGIPLEKIEEKLSTMIPTVEAMGMVRDVLANSETVDANSLSRCTSEKYQFSRKASMKEANKCKVCIYKAAHSCTMQGLKFAASEESADVVKIDPHTEKVVLAENPDVTRDDMAMELDMLDSRWGSGNSIALDKMRKNSNSDDLNLSYNGEGMDAGLLDL